MCAEPEERPFPFKVFSGAQADACSWLSGKIGGECKATNFNESFF